MEVSMNSHLSTALTIPEDMSPEMSYSSAEGPIDLKAMRHQLNCKNWRTFISLYQNLTSRGISSPDIGGVYPVSTIVADVRGSPFEDGLAVRVIIVPRRALTQRDPREGAAHPLTDRSPKVSIEPGREQSWGHNT
jgi:hypothetical protein